MYLVHSKARNEWWTTSASEVQDTMVPASALTLCPRFASRSRTIFTLAHFGEDAPVGGRAHIQFVADGGNVGP